MHAWLGLVVGQFDTTLTQVFATERPTITGPGGAGGAGGNPEEPVNKPSFEWDGTERINILLLGTDAAPDATPSSPTSCSSSAWTRSQKPPS